MSASPEPEFLQYVQKYDPEKHELGWHTAYANALKVEGRYLDKIRETWGTPEAQPGDYLVLLPNGEINVMVGEEFDKHFPSPQLILLPRQPIAMPEGWM